MKKLLVIGAGKGQVDLIRKAKNMGVYVIAVSPRGDYPGIRHADELLEEDIFNVDAIVKYAREVEIDGVISDQSDMATPIVAMVAEALDLPTYGYENALYFTEKSRMRTLFSEIGIPTVPNANITTFDELVSEVAEIGFPCVIKPIDSFASRGVFKLHNKNELKSAFDKAISVSKKKVLIIEKYIEGPQYFCQGLVINNKARIFAFSDRYYFELENLFIPYTNAFPALISKSLQERMNEIFERIICHLKPEFGHVWAEWIYAVEEDILYPIEIALRGAGALVTTDVIPNAYGVDTQTFLIKAALGENAEDFFDEKLNDNAAAFYTFILPEGTVTSVEGIEECKQIDGVVKIENIDIRVGDTIEPIRDKSSRYGPIVIKGKERKELDRIYNKIKRTIKIKVKTQSGIESIIWE